jgi:hypothetical protein
VHHIERWKELVKEDYEKEPEQVAEPFGQERYVIIGK